MEIAPGAILDEFSELQIFGTEGLFKENTPLKQTLQNTCLGFLFLVRDVSGRGILKLLIGMTRTQGKCKQVPVTWLQDATEHFHQHGLEPGPAMLCSDA